MLRDGYFGGVVNIYVNRAVSDDKNCLYYYDVNSLYPTIMLGNFPTGMPEHIIYPSHTTDISGVFGMVRVKVTVSKDIKRPFLLYRHPSKGLILPVGTWVG
jgi:hypothetical protein